MDLSKATWQKSSLSAVNNCVEVAFLDGQVAVRDSKYQAGPVLFFTQPEWQAFLDGVRGGELSYPG